MKTQEELHTIKEEFETQNKKLVELSKEELEQVTGGMRIVVIKASQEPSNMVDMNGLIGGSVTPVAIGEKD